MNGPPRPVRRGVRSALCVPAFASILALSAIAFAEDPPLPELPALPAADPSSAAAAPADAPSPSAAPASSSAAVAPPEAPSSSADVDLLLPSIPADPPAKKPRRATGASRAAPAGTSAPPAPAGSAAVATATFVPPPSPPVALDPDPEQEASDARAREAASKAFTPAMQVGFHAFFWPYLASAIVGGVALESKSSSDLESLGFLVLPGIGPFLSLAVMNDRIGDAARGTLVADGIAQSVGLTTLILAAALRGPARSHTAAAKHGPTVALAPGPGTGLGIRGSF